MSVDEPEGLPPHLHPMARAVVENEERERQVPRKHPEEPLDETNPRSGWLESADFQDSSPADGGIEDRDRRRPTYTRQVCVRLSAAQHAELSNAADLYGVAPGTMARMLVRRGARAVLDARRRYDLEQGGID